MAKITYASLKLKTDNSVDTFDFNGNTIEVLKYLPIKDKYDLITMTLERAEEEGVYNPVMMEAYFHLYLVYMYTNLNFTEKQKENEDKIYDALTSNGLMDLIISNIPEDEYNYLYTMIERTMKEDLQYNTTAASVIKSIIVDLPKSAEAANSSVDNFEPEKFQAVLDFAKAANGGREI